ncbi:CDP-alcohol phosphatidyltransferase family protein [Bacillus sp. B15-48]|nr:CDP-alcohol phosphatidyltransferase family protein [Bacillus sp. B15-48]MBM4762962.1 CDP-alcohol phosphatidyltransferase family protein [Bacillus sp. B15-48]
MLNWGLTANQVTFAAFMIGISASVLIFWGHPFLGVAVLWISGFLDAVDGSMARQSHSSSSWGTVLDVTFDRIVEVGIIIALALRHPDPTILFLLMLLSISIIITMTIFLTVGAVSDKESEKSFYYQPGLAERTEGFILFSLMVLFQSYLVLVTIIFIVVELITGLQRLLEAKRILNETK